jgi:hypothetical protein
MRDVTLIMAYYENPGMLRQQLEHCARMPPEVREHLRVIVVDDGSPASPASPVDTGCPLEMFRVDVDVRWNQDACRNIGARHCVTQWMLLTDMDHVVPAETWYAIMTCDLHEYTAYRFRRVTAPKMDPYKVHPNSYLMTRGLWDMVGGYDERLAGYYGTDGDFRDRITANSAIEVLAFDIIRVPREFVADASTPASYGRKSPEDGAAIQRIKGERRAVPNWRPVTLSFPYHRVHP